MFVHDVMTTGVVTVRTDTHVKAALQLLDRHAITAMPVLDRGGHILGVVSEVDLLRDAFVHDPRASLLPAADSTEVATYVEEVMTNQAIVISQDADVTEAVELITDTAVKSLPVVDANRRLVGILSRHDIVHRLARPDQDIKSGVDEMMTELGIDWTTSVDDGVVVVLGPTTERERRLARAAAATVTGVRAVEIATS